MRKITELLQEIPLDEMMGGPNDMKIAAENNERTIEQATGYARIRSKAPAAAVIAACAAIIAVGAVQFSHNNFEPGAADDDTGITTDAEDVTEENGDTDGQADENEINYMMSRLTYDNFGRDYELAEGNIRPMDGKVGEVVSGFDNLDFRVADVRVCYPYYLIDIAVQTLDGSVVADSSFINLNGDIYVNGKDVEWSCGYLQIYGDKAIATYRLDLTRDSCRELNENSDVEVVIRKFRNTSVEYFGRETVAEGEFRAAFKAGEIIDRDKLADGNYMIWLEQDKLFTWGIEHYAEQRELEFYVNGISWSNCGLTMNISVEKGDEDMEVYELGWALDTVWRKFLKYDTPPEEFIGQYADTIGGKAYFDPERDYNFVKLEYKDGTIADMDHRDLTCILNKNGSYTLYFNNLQDPYDSENVRAFLVGDGRIDIEEGTIVECE